MPGALYGVLPRRALALAVPMLASCVAGTALSDAATPRPVAANRVVVVVKRHARVTQPPILGLDVLEADLSSIAGRPITISCDTPGVPSPIDGRTLDPAAEGEVWPSADGDGYAPVVHASTTTCWHAQITNRIRDRYPAAWVEDDNGRRIDEESGGALFVLLHEVMHVVLGSDDEGLVDCTAVENSWRLVQLFSLPSWSAELVLHGMQDRHARGQDMYHTVC